MKYAPILLLLGTAGCVTDHGRSRHATAPPANARAERVVPVADGRFIDTDANGYGDTNRVIAYVFADPGYDVPLEVEGQFSFTLLDTNGQMLREWSFGREESLRRRVKLPAGPGFVFDLSLLDAGGSDHLTTPEGELVGAFVPVSAAEPIRFRLSAPVVLGRVRPGRSGEHSAPR